MATRFKSVITLLAAAMVVATAACASDPASNIDATIEAGIAATMVGVEIEQAVKATMAPSLAKEHFNRGSLTASWVNTGKPSRNMTWSYS